MTRGAKVSGSRGEIYAGSRRRFFFEFVGDFLVSQSG